ncbi:MAG: FKBP-type peptidyl-prolyl cis-trans isomerase [bacterium]
MTTEDPAGGPPTLPSGTEPVRTASGLEYFEFAPGTGVSVRRGTRVRVSYRAWLTDGTLFESTASRGGALEFILGDGEVLAALDEGVSGMRVGAKRRLIVPSDLAYGPRGRLGSVPPFATLIYDVELLGTE